MEIPAPGSVIPVSYQPDALFPGQDMRRQQLIGMAAGSGHLKQAPANVGQVSVGCFTSPCLKSN